MKRYLAVPTVVAALGLAPAAQAHVTLHPNVVPATQFVELVVRAPNEQADADTTKVEVQFPPGFASVSIAPVEGWIATTTRRQLDKPVTVEGEQHSDEVDVVSWSGGKIGPGKYVDFPISVALPDRPAGTFLTFKTVQTYSNGDVVRWIGEPSSDSPAPQIALADSEAPIQDVPSSSAAAAAARGGTTAAPAPESRGDDDDEGWAEENLPLILGVVGTLAGLGALGLVLLPRERS